MAVNSEELVDTVAGEISQAQDRSIILQNLPEFFTRTQIRGMFREYGQIERVMLLPQVDCSYTLCSLLIMKKKSDMSKILNKGSFIVEGLKVKAKPYSRELHTQILTKGIYKLYVEVVEQETKVKGYNFYKCVEAAFGDCNFTEVKLLRAKPKEFTRIVKLRFKEHGDYMKALKISYKLGVYNNHSPLHLQLQPQPDSTDKKKSDAKKQAADAKDQVVNPVGN